MEEDKELVREAEPVAQLAKEEAAEQGVSVADWVADMLPKGEAALKQMVDEEAEELGFSGQGMLDLIDALDGARHGENAPEETLPSEQWAEVIGNAADAQMSRLQARADLCGVSVDELLGLEDMLLPHAAVKAKNMGLSVRAYSGLALATAVEHRRRHEVAMQVQ